MPLAGLCIMFSVVITATHIAAICGHVECGSCSLLLLMLIELVYNVSTFFLQRHFSHSSSPFYSLIPTVRMPLGVSGEINSCLHWQLYRQGVFYALIFDKNNPHNIQQPHQIHTLVSSFRLSTIWCSTLQ